MIGARSGEKIGVFHFALRFECPDFLGMAQRESNIVPAVQQAFLAKGIDFEGQH